MCDGSAHMVSENISVVTFCRLITYCGLRSSHRQLLSCLRREQSGPRASKHARRVGPAPNFSSWESDHSGNGVDRESRESCMSQRFRSLLTWLPLFFAAAIALAGCNQRPGVDEAIKEQLAETKGSQIGVARFSGTVTIDHQTPSIPRKRALVLILYSAKDDAAGS